MPKILPIQFDLFSETILNCKILQILLVFCFHLQTIYQHAIRQASDANDRRHFQFWLPSKLQ